MKPSTPEVGKRGERPPPIKMQSPEQRPEDVGLPRSFSLDTLASMDTSISLAELASMDKMLKIVIILCIGMVSFFGIAVSTTIGGYRSGYSWGGASGGSAHDATFGGFGRAGSGHAGGAGS